MSTISDVSDLILFNQNFSSRLDELGMNLSDKSVKYTKHMISRFIFCPNEIIKDNIYNLVSQMENKTIIGIQIRTGGNGANSKEQTSFLRVEDLPRITLLVEQLMQPSRAIYVSTDSNYVLEYLNNSTKHHIYFMKNFGRGHSSPVHNKESVVSALEGAICDLGVLSFAKELYITRKSSYGGLAYLLSSSNKLHILK